MNYLEEHSPECKCGVNRWGQPGMGPCIADQTGLTISRGEGSGYKRSDGKMCMVRCFVCGKENYAPAVHSGRCAWCHYDCNEDVKEALAEHNNDLEEHEMSSMPPLSPLHEDRELDVGSIVVTDGEEVVGDSEEE